MSSTNDPEQSDFSSFTLRSKREIVTLLREIGEKNQLVSMVLNEGADTAVTSVVAVDEANGMLLLDSTINAATNRRVLACEKIYFETVLDRIRIMWTGSNVEECIYDDLPGLMLPLPDSMVRLQRREYFRVNTPMSQPARCMIQIPQEQDGKTKTVTVPLQNVGGGGVAIIDEKMEIDDTIGRIYKDCRIELPGATLVVANLEIRNSQEIKLQSGRTIRRIGCVFVNIPSPMLAAVQRYISKLQQEQAAKLSGKR